MTNRTCLALAAIFTLATVVTAARADDFPPVEPRLRNLERAWTDTCDGYDQPKPCIAAARKAVDRLRTLLPQADRHDALRGLFYMSMKTCVEAVQQRPDILNSNKVPISTILSECTVLGYHGVLKEAGGVRPFIEWWINRTKVPEKEVQWLF